MTIRPIQDGWQVEATQTVKYRAYKADALLAHPSQTGRYFGANPDSRRAVRRLFVMDSKVRALWGGAWERYWGSTRIEPTVLELQSRESAKCGATVSRIIDALMDFGVIRVQAGDDERSPIEVWGVGGGVVHDVLGKAIMELDRGIYPWGFVATNALANFDAGYGGKVMVDYRGRKNARGGIYPPSVFISDLAFLRTVERRHLSAALGEVIKVGAVHDAALLELTWQFGRELVEHGFQPTARVTRRVINEIRDRAIFPMLKEQGENLWVTNPRRWQEFGHDAAHEWELAAPDRLLHGEVVAMNIGVLSHLAEMRGECDAWKAERIRETIRRAGLPVYDGVMDDPSYIERALRRAVAKRGQQAIPIPTTNGCKIVDDITLREFIAAIARSRNWAASRNDR